ncbi:methyltransferase domain-containing protein [bacterium CPR1]|nr:methyltransferase domain-containing protein [bacterium CPR1]
MSSYVLGTHDAELQRLGFQAHVWRPRALALFDLAGFGPGQHLLDVGCGPGYVTQDLARIAGVGGEVLAVDASERYIEHLQAQPPLEEQARVQAWVGDAQRLDLAPESLDGAFERWVMCFVPEPERVVASVARALKPGGAFVIQEYANYEAMRLAPRSRAFERVVEVVADSFRQRGGDPDVACRLPGMLEAHGLRVEHLEPVVKAGGPSSEFWQWPEGFFFNYVPLLVERGLLTRAEHEAFERDWWERAGEPLARFYSPVLTEIVARKTS